MNNYEFKIELQFPPRLSNYFAILGESFMIFINIIGKKFFSSRFYRIKMNKILEN